jgi:hypothetical protein
MSFKFCLAALAIALASPAIASPVGHATNAPAERTIQIKPGQPANLVVKRFETIRITDGKQSVTWTFDTQGTPVIPLDKVFAGAEGKIYVDESPLYAY